MTPAKKRGLDLVLLDLNVLGGGAFFAWHNIEFDGAAFLKHLEARLVNAGVVDKHVQTLVCGQKTVALPTVKPSYRSNGHKESSKNKT